MNDAVVGKTSSNSVKDGMENPSRAETGAAPAPSEADRAVIAAFSGDADPEAAFRTRWEPAVAEAEERREQRAAEAERMEIVRRAEDNIAQREKKTAAREKEAMNESKPIDLREFTAQNEFESIPEPEQLEAIETPAPDPVPIPPAERIEAFAEVPEPTRREAKKSAKKRSRRGGDGLTRGERFRINNIPCRGDSKKEIARKVVRIISFIALVAALVYLAFYALDFYERQKQTSEFDTQIKNTENLSDQELADLWADVKANCPDVDFPEGMQVKFSYLYAINSDFVGWLEIENTNIRTPLLQKTNDNYYYLYHDIYKKQNRYGNPYIHCDCKMGPDGLSRNTIIYGHNYRDGLIFHQLTNYMTREGYLNAPIITMNTLYKDIKWKVFAVMLTNSTPAGDNGYVFDYLYPEFSSDDAFMSKIKEIQQRSMIHTGVDVEPTDKILTLYTCYQNIFKGGRLVILARQLREGESEAINAAEVYYDENARFPQAYYGNYGVKDSGNAVVVTAAPATQVPTTAAPATQAEQTESQEAQEAQEPPADEPAGGAESEEETEADG